MTVRHGPRADMVLTARNAGVVMLAFISMLIVSKVCASDDAAQQLSFRASSSRPTGVAAFYEGRGMPPAAIAATRDACFVTASLRSRVDDVVWLTLDNWHFTDATGKPISRLTRVHWKALWEKLGIPHAKRATFGWTLLPEERDLRFDEPVGGNVTLPRVAGTFSLEAHFATGADRRGRELVVRVDGLSCPPE